MRGRIGVMSIMAIAASLGALGGDSSLSRPRRSGAPTPRPQNPEADLAQAEARLAAARTPGAQRKARRKVEAIRAILALATHTSEDPDAP